MSKRRLWALYLDFPFELEHGQAIGVARSNESLSSMELKLRLVDDNQSPILLQMKYE